MRCRLLLLVWIIQATLIAPASAGIFKRSKPVAATGPQDLVIILQTDPDEKKREAAATELRHFDPKANPEIVPVLIDVLKRDTCPAVRAEAAQSLGKLRPICQDAGLALQIAAANDSALRVRLQARTSLIHYQLCGYRIKEEGPAVVNPAGQEPPLAPSVSPGPSVVPPLPPPPARTAPATSSLSSRPTTTLKPSPARPANPSLVPTEPPVLQTPPASTEQGPALSPR
jgi:hypothetical protein